MIWTGSDRGRGEWWRSESSRRKMMGRRKGSRRGERVRQREE
jgi:hypothetical protein